MCEVLAAEDGDGEGSEQEDNAERSGGVGVGSGEAMEAEVGDLVGGVGRQGDDAQGDGESDNELDLLAETESDSDDNHSNQDAASAQRSVQTGATAGSDTGKTTWNIFLSCKLSFNLYNGVSKSPEQFNSRYHPLMGTLKLSFYSPKRKLLSMSKSLHNQQKLEGLLEMLPNFKACGVI